MTRAKSYRSTAQVDHLPLEDRIALSLGHMMMRFAALESMTRFALTRALDLDEEDNHQIIAVVAGLSFRKLREALLAVARGQMGETTRWYELRAITRRVNKAEERRNVLTHSLWNYSKLPSAMAREKFHVSASGTIRSDEETFQDVADLDAFVEEIRAITDDLSFWYIEQYLGVIHHRQAEEARASKE